MYAREAGELVGLGESLSPRLRGGRLGLRIPIRLA